MTGGALGFVGFPLPYVETGILSSVLVLGVLIAGAYKLPLLPSVFMIGFFAAFHGYAHGTELPVSGNVASYTLGFALTTAILHAAGIALVLLAQKWNRPIVNRIAGGAIAMCDVFLAIT